MLQYGHSPRSMVRSRNLIKPIPKANKNSTLHSEYRDLRRLIYLPVTLMKIGEKSYAKM